MQLFRARTSITCRGFLQRQLWRESESLRVANAATLFALALPQAHLVRAAFSRNDPTRGLARAIFIGSSAPSPTVRLAKPTPGRFQPSENFSSISTSLASNGLTGWFAAKETPASVSLLLPLRRRTLNLQKLQTRFETKISGGIAMKKLLFRSLLLVA